MRKHPLVELFQAAMKFRLGLQPKQQRAKPKERRIPRLVYSSENGPAKRVLDSNNRVTYRPWPNNEYTGGKWIKGAPVVGAEVKEHNR